VAYVDASPGECALIEKYFAAHAPALRLATYAPTEFETLSDRWGEFGAVVLGPDLGAARRPELLRRLHSHAGDVPVVVLAAAVDGEAAIAAFKLGAQDFLVRNGAHLVELVFSLNHLMKRRETERQNTRLARELAELNVSLEGQVQKRTRQLQAVSQRLIHVQEAERRVIAQELHDQLGQLLTGLRFQLEAARGGGPGVGEALALTDELLRQVRDLALQLRPRILDDFGLRRALEWHVDRFHRQTGIAVACDITLPAARLSPELETTAFRLVQEALTNVARHAHSPTASLTAALTPDHRLLVEVADCGQGFDVAAARGRHDSLGLTGLAERVKLAGGQLDIVSHAGRGTRICAEFPLPGSLAA
jgi:signal transduction histidine kinase